MSVSLRTLGFYNCYMNGRDNNKEFFNRDFFIKLIKYIASLDSSERLENNEKDKKVCSLKKYELNSDDKDIITLIFTSAKYAHSPDLVSSIDGSTRPTDKQLYEGEEELTHLCLKLKAEKSIILLEERRSGMNITKIISYLNSYIDKLAKEENKKYPYKLFSEIYPVRNVKDIIDHFSRATTLELFVKKDVIRDEMDEMMEFSEIDSPVIRDEVMITIKAGKREEFSNSILKKIKKVADAILGKRESNGKCTRIRMRGKNNANHPISFDTDILKRKEQVESVLNKNGTVNTEDLLKKMIPLVKDLE
ncbi:hypothetical protein [Megasphaera sp.]|uniref:hypothetical protein n=1 Tax=Megasphaera TaxID=906 RepID=UPI001D937B05|nr:hypothetical protein [Megasphaera sp.]MBS6790260.1 hypothetical protein [Megasphaera sp.]